ncbi:hypothetical protein ACXJY6_06990 [Vibrio sp. RC27]
MPKLLLSSITTLLFSISPFAHADIEVRFVESAPKDRFVVNNNGECTMQNITANIDLSNSTGKLIFDTTATGAGVEVFQPFESSDGNIQLAKGNQVNDGATTLSINIATLNANSSTHFTIDVDDTLEQSELGNIRVSESEIENATIKIISMGTTSEARFDKKGQALLAHNNC